MKKRYAFLLSIVLLTGCSGEALTPQDSISQSTTASATTVPTASEAVTDGAQKPTNSETEDTSSGVDLYSPEEKDVIYPTYKEIEWQIKYEADEDDITAQIGYDTPVDVTKLDDYEWVLDYVKELDEEERQELISTNYTYLNYNCHFIGSEKADWLYIATYQLVAAGPMYEGYYTKVFYVKDGKVAEMLAEFEGGSYRRFKCYADEVFFCVDDDAVYSINIETDDVTRICDVSRLGSILYVNEDHLFFFDDEGHINVYYFDSGEVFDTVIYYSIQEGVPYRIYDDHIIFENWCSAIEQYPVNQRIVLDLKTREYAPYYEDVEWEHEARENDERFTVEAGGVKLRITDNTDGGEMVYSLQKLCSENKYERIYWAAAEGNIVYGRLCCDKDAFFVLDLGKNEVYTLIAAYNGFNYDIYDDGGILIERNGSCAVYYPLA